MTHVWNNLKFERSKLLHSQLNNQMMLLVQKHTIKDKIDGTK